MHKMFDYDNFVFTQVILLNNGQTGKTCTILIYKILKATNIIFKVII